jgi:hypothetical protein
MPICAELSLDVFQNLRFTLDSLRKQVSFIANADSEWLCLFSSFELFRTTKSHRRRYGKALLERVAGI